MSNIPTGIVSSCSLHLVYCPSTGVKVTRIFSTRGLHAWYRLPDDNETEQWGTSTRPAHRETDLYLVHELCWQRLLGHFGPGEFHLECLYEALERLPPRIGNTIYYWMPLWRGGQDVRRPEYQNDLAPNSHFGLSNLEELMRFARDPPKPLKPLSEQIVYPSQPPTDCFRVLPSEVLESIAVLLSTRNFLSLRHALRPMTVFFWSPTFWRTRFDINGGRGFLLPMVREFTKPGRRREVDWRLLYYCTCNPNYRWWFQLEVQVWEELRWLRDTTLAIHPGRVRPLDFRGSALYHYYNTIYRDIYVESVKLLLSLS